VTGLLFRRLFLYTRITYLFPSGLYFVRPQAESSRFIFRLLCSTAFEAESDLIGRERPHVTLHDVNGVLRVRHAAVLLSICLSVCLSVTLRRWISDPVSREMELTATPVADTTPSWTCLRARTTAARFLPSISRHYRLDFHI